MALRSVLPIAGLLAGHAAGECTLDPRDGIKSLNGSLGGRVQRIEPFALPCFTEFEGEAKERDEALCAERQANYSSADYRSQIPGAYMYEQSAICASDKMSEEQCLLDTDDPTNAEAWTNTDCRLGNLPSYYIEVQQANDVVEAFNYARNTGSKLTIKNSGHSYVEDSSMQDSLMLWTRKLGHLSHDTEFVPEGCSADETFDAITTGAGVSCGEVYEYADQEDVTIICGYSPTVGISGGWVQGAGHSVLTPVYGLGADRALQFTVVTPDGSVRKANKCRNTDLFWALRGGGGGTFGIVLDSTHKVEAATSMAVAAISIPGDDKEAYNQWVDLLVDTAIDLAEDGWGGHVYGNSIVHVSPLLNSTEEAEKSLRKIIDFAQSHNGSAKISVSPTWYSFFENYVLSDSVAVGNLNIINTRLVPTKVFKDAELAQNLKDYFHDVIAGGGSPYIPVDNPYHWKPEAGETSAHPVWYDSLWEVGQPSYWKWNSTFDERIAIAENMQKQTENQRAAMPGGAVYMNEANPFTNNWEEEFWGRNYERLLDIKNKYDPKRLLRCWRCVGWTEADAEASCYSAFNSLQAA